MTGRLNQMTRETASRSQPDESRGRSFANQITIDPIAIDPIAIDPIAIDPITIDPIAIDPIAIDPIGDLFDEPDDAVSSAAAGTSSCSRMLDAARGPVDRAAFVMFFTLGGDDMDDNVFA
jgi:hypothetical protein